MLRVGLVLSGPVRYRKGLGMQAVIFPHFGEVYMSTLSLTEREALGFEILPAVLCELERNSQQKHSFQHLSLIVVSLQISVSLYIIASSPSLSPCLLEYIYLFIKQFLSLCHQVSWHQILAMIQPCSVTRPGFADERRENALLFLTKPLSLDVIIGPTAWEYFQAKDTVSSDFGLYSAKTVL